MKGYINLLFLLPLLLFSCEGAEVESLFDQSPEERAAVQLDQMKKELVAAPHGWTVYYQYANMTNETYFNIQFQNDGQAVISYPQNDGTVGSETTTYTLRYTQQIDLVFDTHSVLASMVGNTGGDFRFEYSKHEDGNIIFNTRNDATEGAGIFELRKTASAEEFPELMAIRAKMVDDHTKSFYRIMELDNGKKYLMNVMSLRLGWIEWTTEDEIFREKYELIATDDGFRLATPFQADDVTVSRFVMKEDGSFEVWSDNAKVGTLNYGMKPFTYPNTFDALDDETNGIFFAEEFSPVFSRMVDKLVAQDPLFTHFQFYIYRKFLAYFRTNASVRHMIYIMKFGLLSSGDALVMTFDNGIGNAEANDYFDIAVETLQQFHNKSYTIIPRNGVFYLVQDQNPAIWMIVSRL